MKNSDTARIDLFNQQLLALDPTDEDYGLIHSPQTLMITEKKLEKWKQSADAGALILGAVSCRYLIFIKDSMRDEKGDMRPFYGFINIDEAGWNAADVTFNSTDALIEWFAFNVENPIVDVIPCKSVEKLLSPEKVKVRKDENYTIICISPDLRHEWFSVPTKLALVTELSALEDAGYPVEKVTVITPEGYRFTFLEMMLHISHGIVIAGETIYSLTQIDEALAGELKGHDITNLQNPYEEIVNEETVTYSIYQCSKCQATHRVEADLGMENYRKNDEGFFIMDCFDC